MPRIRRRRLRARRSYGEGHVMHLTHGRDFANEGFELDESKRELVDGWFLPEPDLVTDEMREAWPELRERVFAYQEGRRANGWGHEFMPFGWWVFDLGFNPKRVANVLRRMDQRAELARLGVADPEGMSCAEIAAAVKKARKTK